MIIICTTRTSIEHTTLEVSLLAVVENICSYIDVALINKNLRGVEIGKSYEVRLLLDFGNSHESIQSCSLPLSNCRTFIFM